MENKFSYRRVGTSGCEIRDPEDDVFAWTVDELWAALVVTRLNQGGQETDIKTIRYEGGVI